MHSEINVLLYFSSLFQNPQMEKHSQRAINHVYVVEGKLA